MSDSIRIPTSGPIHATVQPPGSKSITNRALVCAAMADGTSTLSGVLDSEDTRVMVDCLQKLGIVTEADWKANQMQVFGTSGKIPSKKADLFVANSGTTIRFLTAMLAAGNGSYRLDGIPRMRERPIGDLLDALKQLDIDAKSETDNDCPPVLIETNGLEGGTASVKGSISSQYLSGLLMMSPLGKKRTRFTSRW